MSTLTKAKAFTVAQRALLEAWLAFYDSWLTSNRVGTKTAARYAAADTGIAVNGRRLAIMAGKLECIFVEKRDKIGRRNLLSGPEWYRLREKVERNRAKAAAAGTVSAAYQAIGCSGVSLNALHEALRAQGIELPLRTPRPEWTGGRAA